MSSEIKRYVGKTRILSPFEADQFEAVIKHDLYRSLFRFQLSTGFRTSEIFHVIDNPESMNINERTIHFKSKRRWDVELQRKDRDIYLSYYDLGALTKFVYDWGAYKLGDKRRKLVSYETINHYMTYWAKRAGFTPAGFGTMTCRKTRYAWLVTTFPELEEIILKNMNYNPHYEKNTKMEFNFSDDDKEYIESLLKGWKGKFVKI